MLIGILLNLREDVHGLQKRHFREQDHEKWGHRATAPFFPPALISEVR